MTGGRFMARRLVTVGAIGGRRGVPFRRVRGCSVVTGRVVAVPRRGVAVSGGGRSRRRRRVPVAGFTAMTVDCAGCTVVVSGGGSVMDMSRPGAWRAAGRVAMTASAAITAMAAVAPSGLTAPFVVPVVAGGEERTPVPALAGVVSVTGRGSHARRGQNPESRHRQPGSEPT